MAVQECSSYVHHKTTFLMLYLITHAPIAPSNTSFSTHVICDNAFYVVARAHLVTTYTHVCLANVANNELVVIASFWCWPLTGAVDRCRLCSQGAELGQQHDYQIAAVGYCWAGEVWKHDTGKLPHTPLHLRVIIIPLRAQIWWSGMAACLLLFWAQE